MERLYPGRKWHGAHDYVESEYNGVIGLDCVARAACVVLDAAGG